MKSAKITNHKKSCVLPAETVNAGRHFLQSVIKFLFFKKILSRDRFIPLRPRYCRNMGKDDATPGTTSFLSIGHYLYYRFSIILGLLLFSHSKIFAQIPADQAPINADTFSKEYTSIVVNTNLLLTGERLLYKVYNNKSSGVSSSLSKIIYVSLRNDRDSSVFYHKLNLENGSADGSFFIPATLETGCYKLLSYTNFSLNNKRDPVSEKDIYIINPFIRSSPRSEKGIEVIEITSGPNDTNIKRKRTGPAGLVIKSDKKQYKVREQIRIDIENTDEEVDLGNCVLSVRKRNPVRISNSERTNARYSSSQNTYYIPEYRGELVSGKVLSVDDERPIAEQVVSLSIPGEEYLFKLDRTNENGVFFFTLDEPYNTGSCVLQVTGKDREKYTPVLFEKKLEINTKVAPTKLKLDPGIKEWLLQRSIYVQVQNAYFDQQRILVAEDSPRVDPYRPVGRRFVLNDYTRFPSLRETFVEVINLARIRKKDDRFVFEVFDPRSPYKDGPWSDLPPLLLIDGAFIQNPEEVIDYPVNEIESIYVFPRPYRHGPMIFRGIIDIETKSPETTQIGSKDYMNIFELQGLEKQKRYQSPDYSIDTFTRIPDYRVQLHWEPRLDLTMPNKSVNFFASDVTGSYEIFLEGYTKDGNPFYVTHEFEIE